MAMIEQQAEMSKAHNRVPDLFVLLSLTATVTTIHVQA
jgi:hypothetical protein